jgi:DNA invertase Pin-like site-specific DNA recombinase
MRIGYARVSKGENVNAQTDELKRAGCSGRGGAIFADLGMSGARADRPQLALALDRLGKGDSLVVWKLDRLSRSLADLMRILERIETAGARLVSLTDSIDTGTAAGRMALQMLGAIAEFERGIMRERTLAGLKAARARGVKMGRRFRLAPDQIAVWCKLANAGEKTIREAALGAGIGLATMKRYLSAWRKERGETGSQFTRLRARRALPASKKRTKRGIAGKVPKADAKRLGIGAARKRTRWRPGPKGQGIPRRSPAKKKKPQARKAPTRSRRTPSRRKS